MQSSTNEWEARVGFQSARISAGAFKTQEEAARAYDRLLLKLKGRRELHRTNFPEEAPAVLAEVEAELEAEAAGAAGSSTSSDVPLFDAMAAADGATDANGDATASPGDDGGIAKRRVSRASALASTAAMRQARASSGAGGRGRAGDDDDDDDDADGFDSGSDNDGGTGHRLDAAEGDSDFEESRKTGTGAGTGQGGSRSGDGGGGGSRAGASGRSGADVGGGGPGNGSGSGSGSGGAGGQHYRGIEKVKSSQARPWLARVTHLGKRVRIATFPTRESAARAYDKRALQLRGRAAMFSLNFPGEMDAVLEQIEKDRAAGIADEVAAVDVPGAGDKPSGFSGSSTGAGAGAGSGSSGGAGAGAGAWLTSSGGAGNSSAAGASAAASSGASSAGKGSAPQLTASAAGTTSGGGKATSKAASNASGGGRALPTGGATFSAGLHQAAGQKFSGGALGSTGSAPFRVGFAPASGGRGSGASAGINTGSFATGVPGLAGIAASAARGASASSHVIPADSSAIVSATLRASGLGALGAGLSLSASAGSLAAMNGTSALAAMGQRMHSELLACTVAIGEALNRLNDAWASLQQAADHHDAPWPAGMLGFPGSSAAVSGGSSGGSGGGSSDPLRDARLAEAMTGVQAAHATLCAAAARNAVATSYGAQLLPQLPLIDTSPAAARASLAGSAATAMHHAQASFTAAQAQMAHLQSASPHNPVAPAFESASAMGHGDPLSTTSAGMAVPTEPNSSATRRDAGVSTSAAGSCGGSTTAPAASFGSNQSAVPQSLTAAAPRIRLVVSRGPSPNMVGLGAGPGPAGGHSAGAASGSGSALAPAGEAQQVPAAPAAAAGGFELANGGDGAAGAAGFASALALSTSAPQAAVPAVSAPSNRWAIDDTAEAESLDTGLIPYRDANPLGGGTAESDCIPFVGEPTVQPEQANISAASHQAAGSSTEHLGEPGREAEHLPTTAPPADAGAVQRAGVPVEA